MYGKPLKPKKTAFTFYGQDGEDLKEDSFEIYLTDLEDDDNDDVREVEHPDFDRLWGNTMENVFQPWIADWKTDEPISDALTTITKAREWLRSIGMKEKLNDEDD